MKSQLGVKEYKRLKNRKENDFLNRFRPDSKRLKIDKKGNIVPDRSMPSNDDSATVPVASSEKSKGKSVCRFFLRGHCRHGEKCRYLHERPEKKAEACIKNVPAHFRPENLSRMVRLIIYLCFC